MNHQAKYLRQKLFCLNHPNTHTHSGRLHYPDSKEWSVIMRLIMHEFQQKEALECFLQHADDIRAVVSLPL